jgi:hypothetical protein
MKFDIFNYEIQFNFIWKYTCSQESKFFKKHLNLYFWRLHLACFKLKWRNVIDLNPARFIMICHLFDPSLKARR